jgi:hypothetical protein
MSIMPEPPIRIAIALSRLVSALMHNQGAYLPWRREQHRCPVTHHAGGQDDRLVGQRAGIARIDLEAEIAFRKLSALTVGRYDRISALGMADGYDAAIRSDLLETWKLRRQSGLRVPRAANLVPDISGGPDARGGYAYEASDNKHQ